MPKYQVRTFQAMAPMMAARMTSWVAAWASISPFAMVLATFCEKNAPAKFRTAHMTMANVGGRTRVEMTVATALAVSWKPFV